MKLFVSYNSLDRDRIKPIVSGLKQESKIECFWDQDIRPSEEFPKRLAYELSIADAFLIFISEDSLRSNWIPKELTKFLALYPDNPVLPVFLDDVKGRDDFRDNDLLFMLSTRVELSTFSKQDQFGQLDISNIIYTIVDSLFLTNNDDESDENQANSIAVPIVSVMGTKGGAGKSTFIAATAELIASGGHTVAIIDADIQSGGITKYTKPRTNPDVWTVMDAAYAKQTGLKQNKPSDAVLVTPDYIWEKDGKYSSAKRGQIYLIPSCAPTDSRDPYKAVADINSLERDQKALEILRSLIDRLFEQLHHVDCILVDCGAENNPLVSAAFVVADYGFLISGPNPEFKSEVSKLSTMHRDRFLDQKISYMHLVVNQANPETINAWQGIRADFIPEDPVLRKAGAGGKFDFEGVGLNNYYYSVLLILRKHLSIEHQGILPDQAKVWIRPYIQAMKTFPEELLRRPSFKFLWMKTILACVIPILALMIGFYIFYFGDYNIDSVVTSTELRNIGSLTDSEFNQLTSGISIPKSIQTKVKWQENQLTIFGKLSKKEEDLLKSISPSPAWNEFAIYSLGHHDVKVQEFFTRSGQPMNIMVIAAIAVALWIVFVIVNHIKSSKRKNVIAKLIEKREKSDENDFLEFLNNLLSSKAGKSHLSWLKNEFEAYTGMMRLQL